MRFLMSWDVAAIHTAAAIIDLADVMCNSSSPLSDVGHATGSQEEGGWLSWFGKEPVGAFFQPSLRPLLPALTHTMFMDVTLNNHSPIQV